MMNHSSRFLPITLTVAMALVGSVRAADELHITHGPILGRVSSTGIGIWARTSETAAFFVRYGTDPTRLDVESKPVPTRLDHDNTGWIHLQGLKPHTRYYYELVLPDAVGRTGRKGTFRTLPDSNACKDAELNPDGLFNFTFEFACGNNQNPSSSGGPALPTFATMLKQHREEIDFAIMNGDWLYETQRLYNTDQWLRQVNRTEADLPGVLKAAPTLTGVWQNYKHFLSLGANLTRWHRNIPSFFTYDDHEILNDVWGAGSPGLRDRRAVYRDVGVRAWYDYLAWSNPTSFTDPIHFGRGTVAAGSDILSDDSADFTKLKLADHNNLHIHWGGKTAGVNDNDLDGVGGDPNAGVYEVVEVLGPHRVKISPNAKQKGTVSYSIGRRSYFHMRMSNCDFFVLDTRGQRQMHDTKQPDKPGLSMLGPVQRDWLMDGMRNSDADFIFVVSSVNFMVPHVGGGKVRTTNKDDAWTVFFDEREKLINFWDKLDKPVFVLTGDLHNSFVIGITDNVWEFASGPHNSNNHWASDEGNRPPNGKFKYGPREVDIHWSTYFRPDIPRHTLQHPHYCIVQINNVFDNPREPGEKRWVAFPRPQVIFRYYDGLTGDLKYAESIRANAGD